MNRKLIAIAMAGALAGLETHAADIANAIRDFLARAVASGKRNAA